MSSPVACTACGSTDFDLADYESLLSLSATTALFTLRCPHCGTQVTAVCAIPEELRADVKAAADKVGAGMGGKRPAGR